jgi:hypothetical protein
MAPCRTKPERKVYAPRDDDLQRRSTAHGNHLQRHVDQSSVAGTVDGLFAQTCQEKIVGEQDEKLQHRAHGNGNGHAQQIGIASFQFTRLIHGRKSLHS